MRAGDEEMIIVFLRCLVSTAYDFGEEFTEHIGEEESDHLTASDAESAGGGVWDELEFVGDALDLIPRFLCNEGTVVEDA
jgi:hypothetical protein